MLPWLARYPATVEADKLIEGFSFGFYIPHSTAGAHMFTDNLKSVRDQPEVVKQKLLAEVDLGRMAGPFTEPPLPNLRVSPLGLVPKKDTGKFRLIHHLSFPPGLSVNDGISREEAAVSYVSFDRAIALVARAGRGALLAKTDIESAFRLLPIHPECFHLFGCKFEGDYYVDMCLPMGCSISCKFFEMFASFLEWTVRDVSGFSSATHYLDDFLFVGPQGSPVCTVLLDTFRFLMKRFGVPLAEEKTVGPVTVLSFLGIELDSVSMVFRLPPDKLARLLTTIEEVLLKKKITLRQLQSLLGLLAFACRTLPMGRVFSRRLSLATVGVSNPQHFIRLTKVLKDDLRVWQSFLVDFNGSSCFPKPVIGNKDLWLFTDAAGSCGYGAIFGKAWSAEKWPEHWQFLGHTKNLTLLELFPIVVALELWAPLMANKRVCFWLDNESVVLAINRISSSSLPVLALLRRLVLRCLQHNIVFRARHVPGVFNVVADSLSRSQWQLFRDMHPLADEEGSRCPESLWNLMETF